MSNSILPASKPVIVRVEPDGSLFVGVPLAARKVRRIARQLHAAGTPFTLTVSETEGTNATRLFYWFAVNEADVRRPGSYGVVYASHICCGVGLSLAHAGSGYRSSERFCTGTLSRVGAPAKKLATLNDFVSWANISCAHPYVATPEQAAEDAAKEAQYAADLAQAPAGCTGDGCTGDGCTGDGCNGSCCTATADP